MDELVSLGNIAEMFSLLKRGFSLFLRCADTHVLELRAALSVLGGSCKVLSAWLTLRE